MSLVGFYLVFSAFLLAFVASTWSSKGMLNLTIKTIYVAGAVFGAVVCGAMLPVATLLGLG